MEQDTVILNIQRYNQLITIERLFTEELNKIRKELNEKADRGLEELAEKMKTELGSGIIDIYIDIYIDRNYRDNAMSRWDYSITKKQEKKKWWQFWK